MWESRTFKSNSFGQMIFWGPTCTERSNTQKFNFRSISAWYYLFLSLSKKAFLCRYLIIFINNYFKSILIDYFKIILQITYFHLIICFLVNCLFPIVAWDYLYRIKFKNFSELTFNVELQREIIWICYQTNKS